jgi:hypothetical protein
MGHRLYTYLVVTFLSQSLRGPSRGDAPSLPNPSATSSELTAVLLLEWIISITRAARKDGGDGHFPPWAVALLRSRSGAVAWRRLRRRRR